MAALATAGIIGGSVLGSYLLNALVKGHYAKGDTPEKAMRRRGLKEEYQRSKAYGMLAEQESGYRTKKRGQKRRREAMGSDADVELMDLLMALRSTGGGAGRGGGGDISQLMQALGMTADAGGGNQISASLDMAAGQPISGRIRQAATTGIDPMLARLGLYPGEQPDMEEALI
jgi:hypothetical protein